MSGKQITFDQHFVPQCYLKNFTSNDWKVFAYNKNWQLLSKKYSPKSILFKNLLYELNLEDPDNTIENFFSRIEDQYSILSKKLLSLKSPEDFNLTQEEQLVLLLFVLRLSLGNPSQYNNLNNKDFDELRMRELEANNLSEKDKKDSLEKLKEHNRKQLPISIKVAFNTTFLTEFMLRKKFVFILTNEDNIFLTSDKPVIERCDKSSWFFSPILTDTNYYVALSPYICLKIIDKDLDINVSNLSICYDKNWEIGKKHNKLMFEYCKNYVYSNIKDFKL